jgi:hypothetical protein
VKLRRDPLGEHARIWLAHWVQPDPEVRVRCGGTISDPIGCGIATLPIRIGEQDSQAVVPSSGPVLLPTAASIARARQQRVRLGLGRSELPRC